MDESSVGSLVLLRRTLFKSHGIDNRFDFAEPYRCGDHVDDGGALLRASWTSKRYLGYADRTVRMEYRLKEGPDTAWANRFLASEPTDESGYVEFFDLVGAEEEGIGGMLPDDGPPCGQTIVFRAHYGGNGTSSGWSAGDPVAEATFFDDLLTFLAEILDEWLQLLGAWRRLVIRRGGWTTRSDFR